VVGGKAGRDRPPVSGDSRAGTGAPDGVAKTRVADEGARRTARDRRRAWRTIVRSIMGRKAVKQERKRAKQAGGGSPKEKPGEQRDWADEAAQARTADDPRTVAPHDPSGRPSTGESL
jgi:hypothetical protein